MQIEFYDEYFNFPSFSDDNSAQKFKDLYIRNKMIYNKIYKFVPFTDDTNLNESKLKMLENSEFWASKYSKFLDKNELKIPYNLFMISRKAGVSMEHVRNLINTTNEINYISCFTYETTDFMWENYANKRNGFCLEFSLVDSDKFFPIIYLQKQKVDFTKDYINVIKNINDIFNNKSLSKVAILPWVLKDKNYKAENELRFLCGDVYDDENGTMGGRIFAGKKDLMNYNGCIYNYDYAGIKLENIIIGDRCDDLYSNRLQDIKKIYYLSNKS